MNRILILEELEAYVFNKLFELYSILYDGWRKILEFLGRGGFFEKNILRKFLEIDYPPPGRGVKFT